MVLRQKFWIDRSVQGALIGRVVLYWTIATIYVGLGSACFQFYAHPEWTVLEHFHALFNQYWPWIPSLVLFMPLVVFDIIRMSNLFAGPIYRLRMHLAELTANPNCRPLTFRSDDYWQDLVAPINYLQNEILALQIALNRAMAAATAEEQRNANQAIEQVADNCKNEEDLDWQDEVHLNEHLASVAGVATATLKSN